MPKYFNVIIVCEFDDAGYKREQFLKYHNIKPSRLPDFWKFVRSIPDVHHINFYDKSKPKGKNFIKQVKKTDIENGVAYIEI